MVEQNESATVRISNIPQSATANDLLQFLESRLGRNSVFAIEIRTERNNWKSRGEGRVQFTSLEAKRRAKRLSMNWNLVFKSENLKVDLEQKAVKYDQEDIIARPVKAHHRVDDSVLHVGFMRKEERLCVLETFKGVRGWVIPGRRVEFWVWREEGKERESCCYKVEVLFEDVLESVGYCLDGGKVNGLLLRLKYGPRIYKKIYGPNVASRFRANRYHFCKEDFDFLWIRTTDFSEIKSIGQSTSFCWEIENELLNSDMSEIFPFYREEKRELILEDGRRFGSTSEVVPLVQCLPGINLPHGVLFQLNALVHTQKISLDDAANLELVEILNSMAIETALMILQKLHKLNSMCYDPVSFVKTQAHVLGRNQKGVPLSSQKKLADRNIMSCYRALITPSKIYCMGPELESSNYVVNNFAAFASDFMRVTFVEEDWTKLYPDAISTSIHKGIFAKPYRTKIYHRILSILRDGIVIGEKKYEFLAFSASQLRSSSVWMFASSDKLRAQDIREWMGCFTKIRSVSKCAARMGQLFSSSRQTLVVLPQDVEMIPDIEVNTDGINYCFSDGIGKISQSFAKQVAQKLGLSHTPSAFQIRYGGFKGVIAVDRNSFRKLSLRSSMLKFESTNRMLNVTKWSESMSCFLNREIITLLSTLKIGDEVFLGKQREQLDLIGKMLTDREAALNALQNLSGADSRSILVKMLLHGYEPNGEPYLSMMIEAHHDSQLSDLKSRCRIHIPKGRLLIGCLDETGILDYGQVYVRVTMTKAELESKDKSSFCKVDEKTSVVTGKVIVTKNPCLHPGDVRVLDAVYVEELEEKGLVDCILFPQKGKRPHPNECSGGDLDGDIFFISWDKELIPTQMDDPMDYTGGRPRIMDHDVTLEEIQKFVVDYMINDCLGAISTAHLVHADREADRARSEICLRLAALQSMAVDFAKTGAPAEMPVAMHPKEYPDFMERFDKPKYISWTVLGVLYREIRYSTMDKHPVDKIAMEESYDCDLEVEGFEDFLKMAETHKAMYEEAMSGLMNYYGAKTEDEILTGNLRIKEGYLIKDRIRYADVKDRILLSVKNLQKEAKGWFESSCEVHEHQRLASAWYHVTYHTSYRNGGKNFLSFPWIMGDILLGIKAVNSRKGIRM